MNEEHQGNYHALHLRGELASTLLFQLGQDAPLMIVIRALVEEQPSSKFFPVPIKKAHD